MFTYYVQYITLHYITMAAYILQMKLSHIIFSPKQLCLLFFIAKFGPEKQIKMRRNAAVTFVSLTGLVAKETVT